MNEPAAKLPTISGPRATSVAHTPGPWTAVDAKYVAIGVAHMQDGNFGKPYRCCAITAPAPMTDKGWRYVAVINGISEGAADSDAQFIVRVCNSHDALLAALESAEKALVSYEVRIEAEWGRCRSSEELEDEHGFSDELYAVRAAIAQARVEQ